MKLQRSHLDARKLSNASLWQLLRQGSRRAYAKSTLLLDIRSTE